MEATVESLGTVHQEKEPTVYVHAKALFIEPKYAALMKVEYPTTDTTLIVASDVELRRQFNDALRF